MVCYVEAPLVAVRVSDSEPIQKFLLNVDSLVFCVVGSIVNRWEL